MFSFFIFHMSAQREFFMLKSVHEMKTPAFADE